MSFKMLLPSCDDNAELKNKILYLEKKIEDLTKLCVEKELTISELKIEINELRECINIKQFYE